MGHKVSPVGMRIGVNKNWNSRWYANDQEYSLFLNQDIKAREYLESSLKDALLSHVEIERVKTDKGYKITVMLFVARPGVVIGQEGKNVEVIKSKLPTTWLSQAIHTRLSSIRRLAGLRKCSSRQRMDGAIFLSNGQGPC